MKTKYFPLIDFFDVPLFRSHRRPAQLLLVSLIAYYHERQRTRGLDTDANIRRMARYEVSISRNEVCKKFNFSKRLLIQAKEDLNKSGRCVSTKRLVSISRTYFKKYKTKTFSVKHSIWPNPRGYKPSKVKIYYMDGNFRNFSGNIVDMDEGIRAYNKRLLPYVDIEDEYKFSIHTRDHNIVNVPVKVIYNKALSISEKLAIVWRLVLESRIGTNLDYKNLARVSGISERTFRKAKKYYPGLFRKKRFSI